MEFSTISLRLRVVIVFRDISYVVIILYSCIWLFVNTFGHMYGTTNPGSCIHWVPGFGIKTGYDKQCRSPRDSDTLHPTLFPSPRYHRPTPSPGPQHHRSPWARDIQSPGCSQTHAIPKPIISSSSPSLQGYIVYFLCHYGPTSPNFDMLH
jgi:hypothetical protein